MEPQKGILGYLVIVLRMEGIEGGEIGKVRRGKNKIS